MNKYKIFFNGTDPIVFATDKDLKQIIEDENLKALWDINKKNFVVLANIAHVRKINE
ncbi:MAG TPA: hypothetical protein VIH12_00525 [Solibacillus sp.]